jgi:hypothetical protein
MDMSFYDVICATGEGKKVARPMWKNKWIKRKFVDPNNRIVIPALCMEYVSGKMCDYRASYKDAMANDWVIVEGLI